MKVCFKCRKAKPLDEFYRHPMMCDGRLGKCKECAKQDVRKNRLEKLAFYRQYDSLRASMPHRVSARAEYRQTEAGKAAVKRAHEKWKLEHPDRRKAQHAVGNAIRNGRISRQPCHVCGAKAEAHHPDYSAPLDVVWLCTAHHREAHELVEAF